MYSLCIYNNVLKKFFYETIDSPYLLNKRIKKIKRSKKLKVSYILKKY